MKTTIVLLAVALVPGAIFYVLLEIDAARWRRRQERLRRRRRGYIHPPSDDDFPRGTP